MNRLLNIFFQLAGVFMIISYRGKAARRDKHEKPPLVVKIFKNLILLKLFNCKWSKLTLRTIQKLYAITNKNDLPV